MSRKRFMGFVAESSSGERRPPEDRFWPFIPMGSDACARCGRVRPFAELDLIDSTDDGEGVYACADGCRSKSETPPGCPHERGCCVSNDTKPLQMPEALCRTRTDDPFLTMVGPSSGRVTSGHPTPPEGSPQEALQDPTGQPERPQNAPTSGRPEPLDAETYSVARSAALGALRLVAILDLEVLERLVVSGERALSLGPILDPTLAREGSGALEHELALYRALRDLRRQIEEVRP